MKGGGPRISAPGSCGLNAQEAGSCLRLRPLWPSTQLFLSGDPVAIRNHLHLLALPLPRAGAIQADLAARGAYVKRNRGESLEGEVVWGLEGQDGVESLSRIIS